MIFFFYLDVGEQRHDANLSDPSDEFIPKYIQLEIHAYYCMDGIKHLLIYLFINYIYLKT